MHCFCIECICVGCTTRLRSYLYIELLIAYPKQSKGLTTMTRFGHKWNWRQWMIKLVFTSWKQWTICEFYLWVSCIKLWSRFIIGSSCVIEIFSFFHCIREKTILLFSKYCKWLIWVYELIDLVNSNIVYKDIFDFYHAINFWSLCCNFLSIFIYEVNLLR